NSILHHRDRNAEFGNAGDKLSRAVEWIDNPHASLVKTGWVINTLLRKPTFPFAKQFVAKNRIDGLVRFGDRIVACFVFCCDVAESETGEDLPRRIQRRLDTLQGLGVRINAHELV